MKHDEAGFVLIELMVSLVILSIMAGLVVLGIETISTSAEAAKDGANEDTCDTAITAYRVDHDGAMPVADGDLSVYFSGPTPDCLP